jgi:hypothetical protein
MFRIICHTSELDEETAIAMDAVWLAAKRAEVPAVLTSIEQVVHRLRQTQRLFFRFADFELQLVLWQQAAPRAAVVQQRQEQHLRCVHLLSWAPTGEIVWEQQQTEAGSGPADDFGDLLGMLVLVPCFAEWSDRSASPSNAAASGFM